MEKTKKILIGFCMLIVVTMTFGMKPLYATTNSYVKQEVVIAKTDEETKKKDESDKSKVRGTEGIIGIFSNSGIYRNEEVEGWGEKIVNVIQVLGVVVAMVVMVILGIKYMTGSMEQRAITKKSMIPYIVGVILLVATTSIIRLVYGIVVGRGAGGKLDDHTHDWNIVYKYDSYYHWQECKVTGCTATRLRGHHNFNDGTGKCRECGCKESKHTHTWVYEGRNAKCSSCLLVCKHSTWEDGKCPNCGYVCEHEYINNNPTCKYCGKEKPKNGDEHIHSWDATTGTCKTCKQQCQHSFSEATGKCIICGFNKENHTHEYADEYSFDQYLHWRPCKYCAYNSIDKGTHIYEIGSNVCTKCGYKSNTLFIDRTTN